MPEGVEGFLERQGTHGFQVVFEQVPQLGGLPDGEVARAFQEAIPGILENGLVALGCELFDFLSPYLVDCFTEFLGNMKVVEHVERIVQHGGDAVEIGLPHVGADDLDFGTTLRAEGLEVAGERLGIPIPDDAEKPLAAAVDLIDESHVFVALAVRYLVDADGGDTIKITVFEAVIDDPFHRPADGVPFGMEAGGGFLPAQAPGP